MCLRHKELVGDALEISNFQMNERDDSGHDSPQERELHKARGFQTLLLFP